MREPRRPRLAVVLERDPTDVRRLLADPAAAATMPAEAIPALLLALRAERSRLDTERARLDAASDALAARLAATAAVTAPLVSIREGARRLGVGEDWLRDHGERLGLVRRLSEGTVRAVPERLEAYKRSAWPPLEASPREIG